MTSISNQKSSSPSDLSNLTSFFCILCNLLFLLRDLHIYQARNSFIIRSIFVRYFLTSSCIDLGVRSVTRCWYSILLFLSVFVNMLSLRRAPGSTLLFNICSIFCRCTGLRVGQISSVYSTFANFTIRNIFTSSNI